MSDRGKRHCMVVHAYYPVGETRVQREALALVRQGYEVDVICLRNEGEPRRSREDAIDIYRMPIMRHKGSGLFLQMLEYLAFFIMASNQLAILQLKRRYQTVQVHNLPDFLVFAALVPKLLGAKILLDLHDLMPEFFAAKSGDSMQGFPVRLVTWQEQLACYFADHVITVTDVWKRTLIDRGVPSQKASVVMNVADTRVFNQDAVGDQPSVESNGFRLLYHGTFTHRYGVDLIIQAVDRLRNSIPELHLTLLGSGETWEELVAMTKSLGLEDFVSIYPTLPVTELPQYIHQADVGIVPNRSNIFTDGILPTKLMEYIALGTPVIVSRTPTIEAYFDDSMVMFFEPGNVADLACCIQSLYEDRKQLVRYAHNADKFNQHYNWENVSTHYVGLVEELAGVNGKLPAQVGP